MLCYSRCRNPCEKDGCLESYVHRLPWAPHPLPPYVHVQANVHTFAAVIFSSRSLHTTSQGLACPSTWALLPGSGYISLLFLVKLHHPLSSSLRFITAQHNYCSDMKVTYNILMLTLLTTVHVKLNHSKKFGWVVCNFAVRCGKVGCFETNHALPKTYRVQRIYCLT